MLSGIPRLTRILLIEAVQQAQASVQLQIEAMDRQDGDPSSGLVLSTGGDLFVLHSNFPPELFDFDQLLLVELWDKILRYHSGHTEPTRTKAETSRLSSSPSRSYSSPLSELGMQSRIEVKRELNGYNSLGKSYRGVINNKEIVIKHVLRIKPLFTDAATFEEHMCRIMSFSHPNILRLLAFSCTRDDLLLVYDYLPNGNLHSRLYGEGSEPFNWDSRMKVAFEVSEALTEIHGSELLIHGRIKLSNVLFDEKGHIQLTDLGVSPLRQECSPTQQDDVKDFGMLLLELLMGKDPYTIIENNKFPIVDLEGEITMVIQKVLEDKCLDDILDKNLVSDCVPQQAIEIFKICISCIGNKEARPCIRDIMESLQNY